MYQNEQLLKRKKELYSKELQRSLETSSVIDVSNSPLLVGFMVGSSDLVNNSIFYSSDTKFLEYVKDVDKHGNSVFDYIRMYKIPNKDNIEIISLETALKSRLTSLNIDPNDLDKKISNKRILDNLTNFEKELDDNFETIYFNVNLNSCLMF